MQAGGAGRCSDCPRVASYGGPASTSARRLRCATHRLKDDVCFSFKLCSQPGCVRQPSFAHSGMTVPVRCSHHKVPQPSPLLIHCGGEWN